MIQEALTIIQAGHEGDLDERGGRGWRGMTVFSISVSFLQCQMDQDRPSM